MRAARIHSFGSPEVIVLEEMPKPVPAAGEVLVRIKAAGVGPWGWLDQGRKECSAAAPSSHAGVRHRRDRRGDGSRGLRTFRRGRSVWREQRTLYRRLRGVCGRVGGMIARKPRTLGFPESASMPVIAVTAWQMLFEQARLTRGQTVLVHGAAGNVGRFPVQLARRQGLHVLATASATDIDELRRLGANDVIDFRSTQFERTTAPVDAVLDLVGADVQDRSFSVLKPGGVLVSAVSSPDQDKAHEHGVRASFFLVAVNSTTLARLAAMTDAGELTASVGCILPFAEARTAHEMLEGLRPHPKGKIVLDLVWAEE
jgi:NADPH:quinone reductase-like Zn-dependent oxidoreductase